MNITNVQYVNDPLSGFSKAMIKAIIDEVEWWVPNNTPSNTHYAEIMRQVDAGTLTIEDAD